MSVRRMTVGSRSASTKVNSITTAAAKTVAYVALAISSRERIRCGGRGKCETQRPGQTKYGDANGAAH